MRDIRLPRAVKYVAVAALASMWKWYYYAPNTYKQLKISQMRKAGTLARRRRTREPSLKLLGTVLVGGTVRLGGGRARGVG